MKSKTLALFLLCAAIGAKAQCSPFQGLGAAQFLDNSGVPLTNGVLYSFQAGTSTQQATFTDSTCGTPNVNPITFTTGARINIWLTTGNFYKFQLCLQNDGSTCAPSDVLFSVDNVPGGASGGGGGGGSGPPFISGSPNPATAGILRCASGDQCLAFRNAANSANLALSKDVNDVLSWAGGSVKFPAVATPSGFTTGFSWLWNDSTANRWKVSNNGAAGVNLVVSGIDINTSDQVTQLHFGATATPLSGTAPTTNQILQWNGTNVVGYGPIEMALVSAINFSGQPNTAICNLAQSVASAQNCQYYNFGFNHTAVRLTVAMDVAPSGCSTNAIVGIRDMTTATTILSQTPTVIGNVTTTGSATITAGDVIGVGLLTAAVGCGTNPNFSAVTVIYQ